MRLYETLQSLGFVFVVVGGWVGWAATLVKSENSGRAGQAPAYQALGTRNSKADDGATGNDDRTVLD